MSNIIYITEPLPVVKIYGKLFSRMAVSETRLNGGRILNNGRHVFYVGFVDLCRD